MTDSDVGSEHNLSDITSLSTIGDYIEQASTGFKTLSISINGVVDLREGQLHKASGYVIAAATKLSEINETKSGCHAFKLLNLVTGKSRAGNFTVSAYNETGSSTEVMKFSATLTLRSDFESN